MAKNTLFNFLSRNEATVQLPHDHTLVLDTDKANHHYYRIECSKQTKIVIKDKENEYKLDNHHISIYQNENRDNPKLSQYHYTAEFTNKLGERYRLHVYFNAFDELFSSIAFEQDTKNGYEVVDSKNLRNQFIILALKHTDPLIKKLRQQHNEAIRVLETRYNDCDERLAKYFDSKEEDVVDELQITKEACGILEELIPLVRSSNYPKLLRFHQMAAHSLQEHQSDQVSTATQNLTKNESAAVREDNSSNVDDAPSSKDEASKADVAFSKTNINPSTSSKNVVSHELEHELKTLSSRFEKLTKASEEIQVKEIEQLLAKTYEISLTYERQIKLNNLQQLQKIRRGLHTLGANLLPILLFTNQFESAALLTSFHHLLHAEKFFSVALQTKNSKLLDFILKYGDVDVNHQPVNVHKTQYPSMVHACFYEDSPSHSMSECLSVLIRHGASLLGPDNKGLPFAYSILSNDTHPLCKAFLMNRDKTIQSTGFIKKLIVLLQAYLERKDISASEARSIKSELKSFKVQLKRLHNAHLDEPSSRFLMKRVNHSEEKYLGTLISKLRKDPEIVALNQAIQKAVHQLNLKTTRAQRRQGKITLANNLENLDKFLEGIDVINLDFDFIKVEVLKNLNNTLQLIEKKSQLIDVQKEITRYPLYSQKGNRKYRENLQKQDVLLQEIKELKSENPLHQDTGALNNAQLDNINKTFESLKEMSNLLTQFSSLFSSKADTSKTLSTEGEKEGIDLTHEEGELEEIVGDLIKKSFGKMS